MLDMVHKTVVLAAFVLPVGLLLLLNLKLLSCPTPAAQDNKPAQHALLRVQSVFRIKSNASETPPDVSSGGSASGKSARKPFLYVTQTESCLSRHFRRPDQLGTEAHSFDVLVFSWSEPCASHEAQSAHVQYIHTERNTTWSEGRNVLFRHIMKQSRDYMYYIFMDDDNLMFFTDTFQFYHNEYVDLNDALDENVVDKYLGFRERRLRRGNNAYREFERFLLELEPAVGVPNICYHDRHDCASTWLPDIWAARCSPHEPFPVPIVSYSVFDAAFNAFHRDALPHLLPYETKMDNVSWHESQKYVNVASDVKFQGQVLAHLLIMSWGPVHRPYPRNSSWGANWERVLSEVRAGVPREYRNETDVVPLRVSKRRKDMIRAPVPPHSRIAPFAHYDLGWRTSDCRDGLEVYKKINDGFNFQNKY